MPYIIMKRSDVPDGTLQILDMEPNTSLRNYTLDPPGQTKYVNAVQNDEVVLRGAGPVVLHREARGLAAWMATNVDDGSGVAASGDITATGAPATAGDTFTVAGQQYVGIAGARTPGANDWDVTGVSVTAVATEIAAAINDPLNGTPAGSVTALVTATPAVGVVAIAANAVGTAGNSIALAEASTSLTVSGAALAGGIDSVSLTAVEANGNAAAVLALYAFGDLTAAAGPLTLIDVNGALVAGVLTATQLPDVLDILAGRQYFVPAGTQVDSDGATFDVQPPVGSTGGPWFVPSTLRPLFLNDGLPLSFVAGELSGYTDSSFVYAGVVGAPNGEAVVVYNDDGSLFTP